MAQKKTARQQEGLSPESIGVKSVLTEELKANPHNPRLLFDKEPMDVLRSSIGKVGILVPLTVFKGRRQDFYTILDGQRRWMCAKDLGLRKVPVNQVAEPTVVQNIVTMFQIHKLREDWELMPTALKLEVLMRELKEIGDKRLSALTGLDQAVVSRCKKLLSYSPKYQDLMLDPDPSKRVKADFFIELYAVRNDRVVSKMPWFKKDKFTRRMLEKYQNPDSDLKSVTTFRVIKQHITNAKNAKKVPAITRKLEQYTFDDNLDIDHLEIQTALVRADVRKLLKSIGRLNESISAIDVDEYFGEDDLWLALERLAAEIRKKLKAADRRPNR